MCDKCKELTANIRAMPIEKRTEAIGMLIATVLVMDDQLNNVLKDLSNGDKSVAGDILIAGLEYGLSFMKSSLEFHKQFNDLKKEMVN